MKILSPAKINLFLHVTGKRPDGYHNLFSLMCPVSLYDDIYLDVDTAKTEIECSGTPVPENETNLAYRAADLYLKTLGKKEKFILKIYKRIPVSAGLGGGSSNAASVLLTLNRHYNRPVSQSELMSMGLSLGADVPFFLFQKPALASGIGQNLEDYGGLFPYHILLINPGVTVSTAAVYQKLNLRLTNCKKNFTYDLLKKSGFDPGRHLCNDLESVTTAEHPEIVTAKKMLVEHGAKGALMSGSGPTVFGLFSDPRKAEKAKTALDGNKGWRLYLAEIVVKNTRYFANNALPMA